MGVMPIRSDDPHAGVQNDTGLSQPGYELIIVKELAFRLLGRPGGRL
jgi:hypothetical protein